MNSDFSKIEILWRSRRTLDANPFANTAFANGNLTSRSQNTDIFHFDILFVNKFKQRLAMTYKLTCKFE
jgi:hypothetical protein